MSSSKVVKPTPVVPSISPRLYRDPKARRDAWDVIHTREQIANAALCKMRTEMNALLPISLIPVEILCEIFAFVASADPMVASTRRYSRRVYRRIGWIRISHVCRSWRETALGCPTLWTDVPLNGGEYWRNAFLTRSRSAAIDIAASRMGTQWNVVSTVLSEHLHRVRKLSAYIQSQDVLDSLSSPAPLLEHLSLDCFVPGPAPLTFPNLFGGYAPRLTTVDISESSVFPAHPTLYSNVSKFSITRSFLEATAYRTPSLSDFFSTLQSMTRIKELRLHGCLPAMSGPPWPDHTLHFPLLSCLDLKGPIAHLSGVLDQMRLAPSCTIRALCQMSENQLSDVHDIPPLVRALRRTGLFGSNEHRDKEAFVIRALSMYSLAEGRLDVSAWGVPHCIDECSSLLDQVDPYLSLVFQWPEELGIQERSHSPVSTLVCQSLPLDDLEVLTIDSVWFGWTAEGWREVFGRCAKVRAVHSVHSEALSLLHALFPESDPDSEGRPKEILFPSLSCVSLFSVNFYTPVIEGSAETTRDWLRRLFQARRAAGHPIARLQAGKKNARLDWADGLRDVVSVDWAHDWPERDTIFASAQAEGTNPHDWDPDWDQPNWD